MADTNATNIKAIAPELTTFIDANANNVVDLILEDVALQITSTTYGVKQESAQRYLAAHFLSLANMAAGGVGGGGAVEMVKIGDEQVKYAKSELADGNRYDETPYGRTYMTIKRGCIGAFMTVKP